MGRSFFAGLLVLVLLSPHHCSAQTAKEFYERIVSSTDSLYLLASIWGNTFLDNLNGTQHYSELTPVRKDLQEFIKDELETFKNTPDVAGSEKLRAALLAFYEYEQGLVEKGFVPFERLSSSSSDDMIAECRSNLKAESSKESDYLNTVNTERRVYTARNGIAPPPVAAPKPAPRRRPPPVTKKTTDTPEPPPPPPQQEARRSPLPHQPPPKPAKEKDEDEDGE